MGENKINNLFNNALLNKELDKFLLGEGVYFILDREYGNHWHYGSYLNYIAPNIENILPKLFWEEINNLLICHHDKNMILDALVAYFIPYYSSSNLVVLKERVKMTPDSTILLIKEMLNKHKGKLKSDIRGTGVTWNSKDGLFGSIIQNLKIIKERGGPNFIPNELS